MSNEKREVITMEDLKRGNGEGWYYLNDLLNRIEDSCKLISKLYELSDLKGGLRVSFGDKIIECRDRQSELLSELGTEFLLCKLDDEVRKYISDRLDEMVC
jgi:hypothetical protein